MTVTTVAWAGTSKLSSDLQSGRLPEKLDVIVQYRTAPTEAHHLKVTAHGGVLRHDFAGIKASHYTVSRAVLAEMADDPEVVRITPDRQVKAHLDQADAAISASMAASYNVNGAGVGVAVIDSGVGPSDDLTGKVVYEQQFIKGAAADTYGHGTHVAGICGVGRGFDGSAVLPHF